MGMQLFWLILSQLLVSVLIMTQNHGDHHHEGFAPGHCPWCAHDHSVLDPHHPIEESVSWHPPVRPAETNVLSLMLVAAGIITGVFTYILHRRIKISEG